MVDHGVCQNCGLVTDPMELTTVQILNLPFCKSCAHAFYLGYNIGMERQAFRHEYSFSRDD